jgi:hypothetical protein
MNLSVCVDLERGIERREEREREREINSAAVLD